MTRTTVEIFGRRFELRATESGERLEELAGYVDRRMRELADVSPHVDTAKLAVLTALNIADELFREQKTEPGTQNRTDTAKGGRVDCTAGRGAGALVTRAAESDEREAPARLVMSKTILEPTPI